MPTRFLSWGSGSIVSKSRNESELEAALETVLRGGIYKDDPVEQKLPAMNSALNLLTKREGGIFILVKECLLNWEIADWLGISRRTVENILHCVYG
jgi:DNA-binding NarL/FixJ family response regulator